VISGIRDAEPASFPITPDLLGEHLGVLLNLAHLVVGIEDQHFIYGSPGVFLLDTLFCLVEFPDTDGRVRGVPVRDGVVLLNLRVVKPDGADVPGVAPAEELALELGVIRIWRIDPAAQHVVLVFDVVPDDAVLLDCAGLEGHQVQLKAKFVCDARRDADPRLLLGTENTLLPLGDGRHTKLGVLALVIYLHTEDGEPLLELRQTHR